MATTLKNGKSCQHPNRTDLKSGGGFRCNDCGGMVHTNQPNQDEASAKSESEQSSLSKSDRWTMQRLAIGGKPRRYYLFKDGERVETEKGIVKLSKAQDRLKELNAGVSASTVKSVNLGAANKATVNAESKKKEELRRQRLRQYETDAGKWIQLFANYSASLEGLRDVTDAFVSQLAACRSKKQQILEAEPLYQSIVEGFKEIRNRDGETFMGCKSQREFFPKHAGVTYEYVQRVRCGKALSDREIQKMLAEGNPEAQHKAQAETERRAKAARKAAEKAGTQTVAAKGTEAPQAAGTNAPPDHRERSAEWKRDHAEDRDGAITITESEQKPDALSQLPDATPSFGISHSPIDDSETWTKEEAARRIIQWTSQCLKTFSVIERRQIVEDVIAKLRDELAFEAADSRGAKQREVVAEPVAVQGGEPVAVQ